MIKVLQILPSLNYCGGVENYLMNYYREIDHSVVSFDFAYHIEQEPNFAKEITTKGGKIFKLPEFSFKTIATIKKEFEKILDKNHYDIIHCHQANGAFLYFKIAKKKHIEFRIIHSHQTRGADKFTHRLRNYPLLILGKQRANKYVACSHLAGKFLFKNKSFTVVNNAIDIKKYAYDIDKRHELRKKYHINDDTFVIGNIGRLCNQKNQSFLIDICEFFVKSGEKNIKFFIVGDGELKASLLNKVSSLELDEYFVFTGAVTDTYAFYNMFDLFVLPSLYEGLPVVGVEAQINQLKVITSTNVTEELNFSSNVSYIPLADINKWVEIIDAEINHFTNNDLFNRYSVNNVDSFDIKKQYLVLQNYYESLVDHGEN